MMKKIVFSIGFFIILMLMCNISNATTISVSPSEPKVGDEVTITVTVSNVHTSSVTANVSGVVSGKIKVVGGDLSGEAKSYSKSGKFTCSKEGNINVEVSSDSSAVLNGQYVDVSAKKTVTVKSKPTTTTTQPDTTTSTSSSKSSEARLSNLGIKPNDFSGFKRDKTEYSTEVPNNVTEVNVYANAVHKNAKISGTGKVSLKEGNNTVKVKVTAEDGKTTKTYTININRKTAEEDNAEASEARLKTLGIKPEEYDFSGFNSDNTEYSVKIPNDLKEIEVYATAKSSKAQITGTGKITLQDGDNELKIEVIAEDGTKKTYTIKVIRNEAERTVIEKFGLSKLLISGIDLEPEFEVGTYEYNITLKENLSSLEIEAEANEDDAIVEILGNENLQEGENTITILVTNKETEEVVTYQIVVNKNLSVEEVEQTSWLKPSTWGKEEKIKVAIIIVLIILIISAIVLKIKISKETEKERNLPGADELDKAIAEHQELSIEETEVGESVEENVVTTTNIEDVPKYEDEPNYIQDIAKNRFGIQDDEQEEIKVKSRKKGKGRHF